MVQLIEPAHLVDDLDPESLVSIAA
jgi:hypothetical protein